MREVAILGCGPAGLATALAGEGLSVFALSTYDTDYLLLRAGDLSAAVQALRRAGCEVG